MERLPAAMYATPRWVDGRRQLNGRPVAGTYLFDGNGFGRAFRSRPCELCKGMLYDLEGRELGSLLGERRLFAKRDLRYHRLEPFLLRHTRAEKGCRIEAFDAAAARAQEAETLAGIRRWLPGSHLEHAWRRARRGAGGLGAYAAAATLDAAKLGALYAALEAATRLL